MTRADSSRLLAGNAPADPKPQAFTILRWVTKPERLCFSPGRDAHTV